MNDLDRLKLMATIIDRVGVLDLSSVSKLVYDLESLFNSISFRSEQFERAFYDFWNFGEIICVTRRVAQQEISEDEQRDLSQRFLPSLRAAITEQLKRTAVPPRRLTMRSSERVPRR